MGFRRPQPMLEMAVALFLTFLVKGYHDAFVMGKTTLVQSIVMARSSVVPHQRLTSSRPRYAHLFDTGPTSHVGYRAPVNH
jgi:hypothetical protein